MRWDQLFADLEARFDEIADAELLSELPDRQRVAAGAVTVVARLGGAIGRPIRLRTVAGIVVAGRLRSVGPDWALLEEGQGREIVASLSGVTVIEGLVGGTAGPLSGVARRLDLRYMLRGIARDRSPVAVVVPGSAPGGVEGTGTEITGTIDRVGADFLELALHAPWEPRRAASVRAVVAIPLTSIVFVRAVALA